VDIKKLKSCPQMPASIFMTVKVAERY